MLRRCSLLKYKRLLMHRTRRRPTRTDSIERRPVPAPHVTRTRSRRRRCSDGRTHRTPGTRRPDVLRRRNYFSANFISLSVLALSCLTGRDCTAVSTNGALSFDCKAKKKLQARKSSSLDFLRGGGCVLVFECRSNRWLLNMHNNHHKTTVKKTTHDIYKQYSLT